MAKVRTHSITNDDDNGAWLILAPNGDRYLAYDRDMDCGLSCNLYKLEEVATDISIDQCERFVNGGNPIMEHPTVIEPKS